MTVFFFALGLTDNPVIFRSNSYISFHFRRGRGRFLRVCLKR